MNRAFQNCRFKNQIRAKLPSTNHHPYSQFRLPSPNSPWCRTPAATALPSASSSSRSRTYSYRSSCNSSSISSSCKPRCMQPSSPPSTIRFRCSSRQSSSNSKISSYRLLNTQPRRSNPYRLTQQWTNQLNNLVATLWHNKQRSWATRLWSLKDTSLNWHHKNS